MYSNNVLMQFPAVGVDEGDGEARGAVAKPRFRRAEEVHAHSGVPFDRGVQKIASRYSRQVQENHEEAAMKVGPDQRQRDQPPSSFVSPAAARSVRCRVTVKKSRVKRWGRANQ